MHNARAVPPDWPCSLAKIKSVTPVELARALQRHVSSHHPGGYGPTDATRQASSAPPNAGYL